MTLDICRIAANMTLPLVVVGTIGGAALAGAAGAAAVTEAPTTAGTFDTAESPDLPQHPAQLPSAIAPRVDGSTKQHGTGPATDGTIANLPSVSAPTTKDVLDRHPWPVPGAADKGTLYPRSSAIGGYAGG